jgi:hypothetical protein
VYFYPFDFIKTERTTEKEFIIAHPFLLKMI